MRNNNKGFVVSAVLYPLLVLFLALIMGFLSMSDTRKRILDKMKLEISDSIFDEATCSCDTILNSIEKLRKDIAGISFGGGGGNIPGQVVTADIKVSGYETESELPLTCTKNEIAVVTSTEITNYYLAATAPVNPNEGTVWIVQDNTSKYFLETEDSKIGVSYAMQYEGEKWQLKKAYLCTDKWTLLYYVDDAEDTQNVQTIYNYEYTGEYQEFRAPFAGYYLIELWGARGGTINAGGGNGAYTSGTIYLNAGQGFYVYVGGTGSGATAGWNGGGNGSGTYGAGGGGATDIRLLPTSSKTIWNDFESLKSRIMVAAGGGGGSYGAGGGGGGGLTGNNGGAYTNNSNYYGTAGIGATQSLAGYLNGSPSYALGGFGYAGNTYGGNGAGGGGGYYGGGGGYANRTDAISGGSGGGGSSYISGHEGCNSITESSITTDITHTGLSYHYSGFYFINSTMIAGNNSGAGKAKISLKSVEVKTEEELEEKKEETQTRWNFTYAGATASSGKMQTFTVPKNGQYKIELWGARGGTINAGGGNGAYTSGTIYLEKGQILYIYVGGIGYNSTGGWNGGANGTGGYGAGGGGATDIRILNTASKTIWNDFEGLASRIMVAAGGGGGSYGAGGGAGGTLVGNNGGAYTNNSSYYGTAAIGGTQTLPGFLSGSPTSGLGDFGIGGASAGGNGGGGGGGYYGGGGGYANRTDAISGGSGSGGSSYISGHDRCNSVDKNSLQYNVLHNGSAYHYSGYYFETTTMLAGNEIMPSPTSTNTMTGNSGAGYARITQLGTDTKTLDKLKDEIYNKETTWNYTFSGANHSDGRYQLFTAPKNGTYSVQLWGARGGTGHYEAGSGAYTYGEIYMNAGEKYYVYVGGEGYGAFAGWNGGGTGSGSYGGGGGGATDIRLETTTDLNIWKEFNSLKSRIMVAGGGGGGSFTTYGGNAGILAGSNGSAYTNNSNYYGTAGIGATQSQPGYLNGSPTNTTGLGGFGYAGSTNGGNGAGGGGGYYGGGGGYANRSDNISGGSGGGGSSYISGYEGCNSVAEISTSTEITHTGSIYHYNKYYFTDTRIASGSEEMPSPYTSSSMKGNKGDGYARIMLLKEETKNRDELSTDARNKENLWQYDYAGTTQISGTYQIFETPHDGYYKIDLWGAQGGTINAGGGNGAYTSGRIYLTKGRKLYIYVGGLGYSTTGGWNGGANGTGGYGAGGGGATDVRIINTPLLNVWNNFASLESRIMVAAGGGGGSYGTGGGAGGTLVGNNGGAYTNSSSHSGTAGLGATQALPGYLNGSPTSSVGDFGIAGASAGGNGAGGGGGYYGGGGGYSTRTDAVSGGSGGGGTSYISGYIGCNSIEEESVADNIIHNGSAYHYSGYYFDTTSMLAGNEILPAPTGGGTITGKTGNGYAKITLLKKTTKTLETLKDEIVADEYKWVYTYSGNNHTTGRYQVFNVTKDGTYSIELWGARGGTINGGGGLGAYTYGEISLEKGEQLYLYVGGSGLSSIAGWNGAGSGSGSYGGGGGGSTDIRTKVTTDINLWNESNPLKSRIMVAAGGGGGSYGASGGAGGGLSGYNGGAYTNNSSYYGTLGLGATQIAAGYLNGSPTNTTGLGGFGYSGSTVGGNGAGGGSGWYGGGGGYANRSDAISGGSGGGGSSYISGHEGCIAVTSAGSPKVQTYSKLSDSISHTGYTFVNTQMIDGQGYPWTTVKSGATSGMPSPTGILTQTGQAGDGYAIIHYLGE